ncbi:MAG: hypothetical protein A3K19_12025 [Lentisphaerae bacterium RIFOXYB12_FULL_65_16]|nr:MAG: hypothetical protein A3K18_10205 [Lentisphaerae bacterium RIFOXYA12_64_32]OGV91081.1 MAG: hypothetical protein A3K19_12025 [Lentisphaerae bacterium RIFOXYB12_FULL_65_16]
MRSGSARPAPKRGPSAGLSGEAAWAKSDPRLRTSGRDGPEHPAAVPEVPRHCRLAHCQPRQPTAKPAAWRRAFTLIETMVAILLLVLIMVLVFRFYSHAERVWRGTAALGDVYDSARMLFAVVTEDLQAAMTEGDAPPERLIFFHQETGDQLWFVTTGAPGPGATSDILEVSYRLEGTQFRRAFRDNSTTGWHVFGLRDRLDAPTADMVLTDNVMAMEIACYGMDGAMQPIPGLAATETALPAAVSLSVTLMDSKSLDLWRRLPDSAKDGFVRAQARTVTKRLFLGANTR